MKAREIVVALVVVLLGLAAFGWSRQTALQREAALKGSGPIAGVTMIHFQASW